MSEDPLEPGGPAGSVQEETERLLQVLLDQGAQSESVAAAPPGLRRVVGAVAGFDGALLTRVADATSLLAEGMHVAAKLLRAAGAQATSGAAAPERPAPAAHRHTPTPPSAPAREPTRPPRPRPAPPAAAGPVAAAAPPRPPLVASARIDAAEVRLAVVDPQGRVLGDAVAPRPPEPTALAGLVDQLLVGLLGHGEPAALGVALGPGSEPLPVRAALRERLGLPVQVVDDQQAAAWGEYVHGAGQGLPGLVLIGLDQGVRGAIVQAGTPLIGAFGQAGRFGHLRVVPDGRACPCGRDGCWEQYTGSSAVLRAGRTLVRRSPGDAGTLSSRCGGDAAALVVDDIVQAALEGDPVATGLLAEAGRWLGEGAAVLAAVVDPAVFVVQGDLAAAADLVLAPAARAYRAARGPGDASRAHWAPSALGVDAATIGAAARAREDIAGAGTSTSTGAWR